MSTILPHTTHFDIEVDLLLEAIERAYGYDFRDYSKAHVRRIVLARLEQSKLESVSMLQHLILYDDRFAESFLHDLSIRVTEMFRDPPFFKALREQVMPILRTWSFIRVWHAGCSTGEEVYSMAIVLKEEGLFDRAQIYATDFNSSALERARAGIYPADRMQKYAQNYHNSGAKTSFSDYYYAEEDTAVMDASLKDNIMWGNHNLVTDGDFAEMHLILCRNVMIYFNRDLQSKVHQLFAESLVNGGILCLGAKETIDSTDWKHAYEAMDKRQKIYKKKYEV